MLFRLPAEVLVLLLPALLFALCVHEFAHAYMAFRCGDETATRRGRLTLNPMAHIDPMGTLMILFVGFGWAKPVPVNPFNLRNPQTDMMKVAFAGPATNLGFAFLGGIVLRMFGFNSIYLLMTSGNNFLVFVFYFVYINIMLAVFNMIPVAPLDGSQIFSGLMGRKYPKLVQKLQIHGPQFLFGIIIIGYFTNLHVIGWIIRPFLELFLYLFAGIS